MIPKGTRIKVLVEGATDTYFPLSATDLQTGTMDILSKLFVVHSLSVMPRSTSWTGLADWPYRAELDLTTKVAYSKADDPASIVANAFYQIASALPAACVDGYGQCAISLIPSVDPSKEPGGFGLAAFALIALIAITATGVFVAKRG